MGSFSKIAGTVIGKVRELGRLTPMAIVTMVLPMAGSAALIAFGYPLGNWLRENWEIGSLAFFVGLVIFCGFALLPTNLVGVLAGWSFGFAFASVLMIIGVTGSAIIAYFFNRRITPETLPALAARNVRANAIYKTLLNEGFGKTTMVVTLLRMSVAMPFAFSNFFLAAARVPVASYIVGTFLGMLPRTSATAFLGAGLSELTLERTTDFWMLAAGIAATVLLIVVLTILSRRALDRLTLEAAVADGANAAKTL